LFTGAGGMDVGFERSGFDVVWANDINLAACKTYALNHTGKISCGPIQEHLDEMSRFSGVDLVFGGPPCHGFLLLAKWIQMSAGAKCFGTFSMWLSASGLRFSSARM
jgi:DNA (cytosine-5)-methyltransferase 1